MSKSTGVVRRTRRLQRPNPWPQYEAEKRAWCARNPEATPEQYEAAMRSIAERLGV